MVCKVRNRTPQLARSKKARNRPLPRNDQAPRTVVRFGGKYLFRGEDVTALEGGWEDERLVILEFETVEAAWAWYRSAEYQRLRELRQGAADAVILLAGAREGGEGAHG